MIYEYFILIYTLKKGETNYDVDLQVNNSNKKRFNTWLSNNQNRKK